MIGIFWIYEDKIYSYKEPLSDLSNQDVEMGHIVYWKVLQGTYKIFQNFEYDYISRGRVLLKDEEIIVYSGKHIIHDTQFQNLIIKEFDLENPTFKYDSHYSKILDLWS